MSKFNLKKMLKLGICGLLTTSIFTFGSVSTTHAADVPEQLPSYKTVTEAFDWGPAISKLVVNLGQPVNINQVDKNSFRVHVKRILPDGSITIAEALRRSNPNNTVLGTESKSDADLEGDVIITDAYVSDENGNRSYVRGNYVTIELKVAPNYVLTSPLNFDLNTFFNSWVDSQYTITASRIGNVANVVVNNKQGNIRPQADKFNYGAYSIPFATDPANAGFNDSMAFASYEPKDNLKHPLIVWLHGGGEGGTEPTLPIMGNKAVEFAEDSIQHYFGGAYVLAPQARNFWMLSYGDQGMTFADRNAVYSHTLLGLIKKYAEEHPGVDTSRIYIGGDSNGGYMTLVMIRDNPGFFAAAFPTCEGLADSIITESDLRAIAQTPTWFIAAKTDTTLPPDKYVVPTYNRLRNIGADVHFSFFDRIVDETGLYTNDDGSAYEYPGHWSWIYVYNDRCEEVIDGVNTKLFQWMANQHR